MYHDLEVLPNPDALARRAAAYVAQRARRAVDRRGYFTLAVSGGRTPWPMIAALTEEELTWDRVLIYQVDERIAPYGDADRNLTHLRASLGDAPAEILPMPVDRRDLIRAAAWYGTVLPARFDVVHLGLGTDGHTASLVPGDPVLDVTDGLVGLTGEYEGWHRMTLTYLALRRAEQLLWLVTGADRRHPLHALLAGDRSIPAGRVVAAWSLVLADRAAA